MRRKGGKGCSWREERELRDGLPQKFPISPCVNLLNQNKIQNLTKKSKKGPERPLFVVFCNVFCNLFCTGFFSHKVKLQNTRAKHTNIFPVPLGVRLHTSRRPHQSLRPRLPQ